MLERIINSSIISFTAFDEMVRTSAGHPLIAVFW
jgi:hypothetical protein